MDLLHPDAVSSGASFPPELERLASQNLISFEPWSVIASEQARVLFDGLRSRYQRGYFPFARRQDNDDVACLDPTRPGAVVVVHDFARAGSEVKTVYETFWDWFRAAIEDMIEF